MYEFMVGDMMPSRTDEIVTSFSNTMSAKCRVLKGFEKADIRLELDRVAPDNHSLCPRGSGLSYADMILNENNSILDFSHLDKIIEWSPQTGEILVQAGVKIGAVLWVGHQHGWHLGCCPGSPEITVGGAVSNNVHGKDSSSFGNFGKQVRELKILTVDGQEKKLRADSINDATLFEAVISGMGLIGIIVEVKLQLACIPSPFVRTKNEISHNIEMTLQNLDRDDGYPFKVAWCDAFSTGKSLGRGYVSMAAWDKSEDSINLDRLKRSLRPSKQVLDLFPPKPFWYCSRPFFGPFVIKKLNTLMFHRAKSSGIFSTKQEFLTQLFNEFNFVHNKLPNMNDVYKPYGFVEIQPLIPRAAGHEAVRELLQMCQKNGWQSLLCGIKRHSPDRYMLSYADDGYSVGIDIALRGRTKSDIIKISNKIFDFVIECKGKVYLAKDG
jgi:decaprenylphospho-beta-D-ribofuranose 2-oxidase